ncbi:MAG: anthranilate phosphoribosyltransferase [Chloroflexota bacterium]|nr:anthranilate phosphoribosyltransferase [Chloroflexota bacterium]
MSDIVRAALATVIGGGSLSRAQAETVMGAVMDGEVAPAPLAALLIALRMRTETADELTGFVQAMRRRVVPVPAPPGAIDTCGTGGDGHHTFNVSTAAALVVSACGVPVAKHGNRAVTSASGSSDVIDALGLAVESAPDEAARALVEVGFAFLHAPGFHPGMRHAGPTRRELGVRTAFNLVGPMVNPAGVRRQLLGVADPDAARTVAEVLRALGTERAFVVYGDRIDELPLDGSGVILDVSPAGIRRRVVGPAESGLPLASTEALRGGDPQRNAAIIRDVFSGRGTAAQRDAVALNAGAALEVAGRADDLPEGVAMALEAISGGAAGEQLDRLRARAVAAAGTSRAVATP